MSAGYDGSIRIDTRVDTKGMAKGTKSISNSLSGVLRALKSVGVAIGLAFSGAFIANFVKDTLGSFNLLGSSIGRNVKLITDSMSVLKTAVAQVFAQLLIALTPAIITVIGWLTNLFTILAAVVRVLFNVQEGMGAVADNTKKAGKAAKGALAPFDQLNVLQKPDQGSGDADAGKPVLSPFTIPDDLLTKLEDLKKQVLDFIAPISKAFTELKDAVVKALGPLWDWLQENFIEPFKKWIKEELPKMVDWLVKKLNDLTDWINKNPDKFRDFIFVLGLLVLAILGIVIAIGIAAALIPVFEFIGGVILFVAGAFAFLATPIGLVILVIIALIAIIIALIVRWDDVKKKAAEVWVTIQQIWAIVAWWLQENVGKPMMKAFETALDFIKIKFETIFTGIKNFVTGIINGIIDLINRMVNSVLNGLSSITSGTSSIAPGINSGRSTRSSFPQIPRMATGAVIPPNAQFAAILGDQRSGKNIEAPAAMLEEMLNRAVASAGANQNITIRFTGSGSDIARMLKPELDKENIRVGHSLVKGMR